MLIYLQMIDTDEDKTKFEILYIDQTTTYA